MSLISKASWCQRDLNPLDRIALAIREPDGTLPIVGLLRPVAGCLYYLEYHHVYPPIESDFWHLILIGEKPAPEMAFVDLLPV